MIAANEGRSCIAIHILKKPVNPVGALENEGITVHQNGVLEAEMVEPWYSYLDEAQVGGGARKQTRADR